MIINFIQFLFSLIKKPSMLQVNLMIIYLTFMIYNLFLLVIPFSRNKRNTTPFLIISSSTIILRRSRNGTLIISLLDVFFQVSV